MVPIQAGSMMTGQLWKKKFFALISGILTKVSYQSHNRNTEASLPLLELIYLFKEIVMKHYESSQELVQNWRPISYLRYILNPSGCIRISS